MVNDFISHQADQVLREAASMSVFCREHPLTPWRPFLKSHKVLCAKDLRYRRSGTTVRITGLMVIIHTPPIKSGKRILFVTLEDETGLIDAVVLPEVQQEYAKTVWTSEILTFEGRLRRQGNGQAISITVEKVIKELSGKISDLINK